MGSEFPIPRDQVPQIQVSEVEHDARKLQMERMLLQTLADYDQVRDTTGDQVFVDPMRWKPIGSRDQLTVYRERSMFSASGQSGRGVLTQQISGASTATSTHSGTGGVRAPLGSSYSNGGEDYSVDDYGIRLIGSWCGDRQRKPSASSPSSGESSIRGTVLGGAGPPTGLTTANNASKPAGGSDSSRPILLLGEMPGLVGNVLTAVVSRSQAELMVSSRFVHDDLADSLLVHTLEGPTSSRPFHFLGYKWIAKKPLRFGKFRDSFHIDYTGMTTTSQGERIGFLMRHSVEHPDFPLMTDRNCIRSTQSMRFLYRQKTAHTVQVFMSGDVTFPRGLLTRPMTAALCSDMLLSIIRLTDCAEAKRLTRMTIHGRHARETQLYSGRLNLSACMLCQQKKKFYNTVSLSDCIVCGHFVCARCRSVRHVYISEGILGRYERVQCCVACIAQANKVPRPSPPRQRRSGGGLQHSQRSLHSQHSLPLQHTQDLPTSGPRAQAERTSARTVGPAPALGHRRQRHSSSFMTEHLSSHPRISEDSRSHRSSSDSSLITAEMAAKALSHSPEKEDLLPGEGGISRQRKDYSYLERHEDSDVMTAQSHGAYDGNPKLINAKTIARTTPYHSLQGSGSINVFQQMLDSRTAADSVAQRQRGLNSSRGGSGARKAPVGGLI